MIQTGFILKNVSPRTMTVNYFGTRIEFGSGQQRNKFGNGKLFQDEDCGEMYLKNREYGIVYLNDPAIVKEEWTEDEFKEHERKVIVKGLEEFQRWCNKQFSNFFQKNAELNAERLPTQEVQQYTELMNVMDWGDEAATQCKVLGGKVLWSRNNITTKLTGKPADEITKEAVKHKRDEFDQLKANFELISQQNFELQKQVKDLLSLLKPDDGVSVKPKTKSA